MMLIPDYRRQMVFALYTFRDRTHTFLLALLLVISLVLSGCSDNGKKPPKGAAKTFTGEAYINDKATRDDDYVLLSPAGNDRPFATLTVTWKGDAATTFSLASAGVGAVSFDDAGPHAISPNQTKTVKIYGDTVSNAKDDTKIQIKDGTTVYKELPITVIDGVILHFTGSFQCRLATDTDASTEPVGTALGWTYKLPDEPNLDRILRFSNPVALRKYVPFTAVSITKLEATKPAGFITTKGDAAIGKNVDLGPNTLFDGNNTAGNPPINAAAQEPLEDFEFHIGNMFDGQSTVPPKGQGFTWVAAIVADINNPAPAGSLNNILWRARYLKLVADYAALTPAEQAAPAGVSLNFRINKMAGNYVSPNNGHQLFYAATGDTTGDVDKNIAVTPGGSNTMIVYKNATAFALKITFSKFDPEALVGDVVGTIKVK